jgi:hypothetical protein
VSHQPLLPKATAGKRGSRRKYTQTEDNPEEETDSGEMERGIREDQLADPRGSIESPPAAAAAAAVASSSSTAVDPPAEPEQDRLNSQLQDHDEKKEPIKDAAEVARESSSSPIKAAGRTGSEEPSIDTHKEGIRQAKHENADILRPMKEALGITPPQSEAEKAQKQPLLSPEVEEVTAGIVFPTDEEQQKWSGGTWGLDKAQLQTLANRFRPVVILSPHEQYRPCTFQQYLTLVSLYYDPENSENIERYIKLKDAPTEADLLPEGLYALLLSYKERTKDPRLENLNFDNMQRSNFHMSVRNEQMREGVNWEELNTVPFYCRVRKYADHWEFLYMTVYAYNGPYNVCGRSVEPHSADIEHMTVRTDAEGKRVQWVYFGSHGSADGVWRRADKVRFRPADLNHGTRPIVYSADHGQ